MAMFLTASGASPLTESSDANADPGWRVLRSEIEKLDSISHRLLAGEDMYRVSMHGAFASNNSKLTVVKCMDFGTSIFSGFTLADR